MKQPKPDRSLTRRQFLTASAAGAGLIAVPGFLASCGGAVAPTATAAVEAVEKPVPLVGFFGAYGIDQELLGAVLSRSLSRGGEYADLFFQHTRTNYVGLQDGEVNQAYAQVELGCGVRVVRGDQTGFAFTEDLTRESLLDAATTAAVVAEGPAADAFTAPRRVDIPSHYEIELPWSEIGIDKKIPYVDQADKRARKHDSRIVKVTVFLSDSTCNALIARSDGSVVEDYQPMTEIWVSCVGDQDGRRETNGWAYGVRRGFEYYSPKRIDELADEAARRTITQFEATPPPAGEYPVVLAPGLSGILLHEAMGHGFEADFNRKGTSIFEGRIGEKIAPEFVTIADDGTNPHERGSINVDDEGTETQRTVLVENGVLRSYMHDRISAAHYKVAPTGNGRRESYCYPPVPRMRNTYMENGPHDPEEIIRSVKKGVYAEGFTNGQVDIGAGDFSFYLKDGYLIEDGKLTRPVKDANLIGFGPKVLELVEMVGNDMELYSGPGYCGKDGQRVPVGFGLPTIKCGGISIGGVG
jgi:TldD protein